MVIKNYKSIIKTKIQTERFSYALRAVSGGANKTFAPYIELDLI